MFKWIINRSKKKIDGSGGLQEKMYAIEKTNKVADEVLRKMSILKGDRREKRIPFVGLDRRIRTP